MLANPLKIISSTRNNRTGILFYCIKGSDSKKSGDSASDKKGISKCGTNVKNKKVTKAQICNVCRACPCECNPSAPTVYDCRKYGHNLPSDGVQHPFETLPDIPSGIFRCTAGEVLGRGASKCSCYQNPEYFSYQHMTFYDFHMALRRYRRPSAKTGRKK